MAQTRVQQVPDEIARLSPEERRELAQALPDVFDRASDGGGPTVETVKNAIAVRERTAARLRAEGKPLFSIVDDLDIVRDERLADLSGHGPGR